jgi:hypothetical protein
MGPPMALHAERRRKRPWRKVRGRGLNVNLNLNLILILNPKLRTLQDKTVAEGVVTRRHDIKVASC